MKAILILLATFGITLLTSALLDITWISGSWPRTIVVWLLMACELAAGVFVFNAAYKKSE
jgi:hypothetical protein